MAQSPNQVDCSTLFTPGRACAGPTAVVLHEFKSGIEMLDNEMCRCIRPRPLTSPGCHTSYHYGVSGNCNFRQYVDDADTAWGFYYIPTPACPVPPCPIVQTCDGIGADQYNPDVDGNLPTPTVAAGPDLTANCSVIHVAVTTGAAFTGSGIYCIGSHNFSERAYNCLVQSLCYIFDTNGITPDGYTTLLTHIGELMDLDLYQLAIDIQACLDAVPPPLPPCECTPDQTPLTVVDTPTLNLTASGTENHTLTGNVVVSPTAGNTLVTDAGGLLVPTVVQTPITVNDSETVDLAVSGTNNHTLTASVVISPNAGNIITTDGDGLFAEATVAISADAGNQVVENLDGLFVPDPIPTNLGCAAAPNANLNNYQFLGSNNEGALAFIKIGDPVQVLTGTILNLTAQLTNGKNIFIANIDDQELHIQNPPDAACQTKEIWIKNINVGALTVHATPNTIDGQADFVLAPPIAVTASGDAIHLVWSTTLDTWFILGNYDNNNA